MPVMAGLSPGHPASAGYSASPSRMRGSQASEATPSFGRLCPRMTTERFYFSGTCTNSASSVGVSGRGMYLNFTASVTS